MPQRLLFASLACLSAVLTVAVQLPGKWIEIKPVEIKPIRLTVQPAAEPVPALRYVLLPEVVEQTSGNAALLYVRAFSPDW